MADSVVTKHATCSSQCGTSLLDFCGHILAKSPLNSQFEISNPLFFQPNVTEMGRHYTGKIIELLHSFPHPLFISSGSPIGNQRMRFRNFCFGLVHGGYFTVQWASVLYSSYQLKKKQNHKPKQTKFF